MARTKMIMLKNVGLGDFYIIIQILQLQLGKDLINKYGSKKDSYIPSDLLLAVPLSPSSIPIIKAKGTALSMLQG